MESKTKKSFYNVFIMIFQTLATSLLTLISTSLILKNYGSDFNGVVATATQFISILSIIEGGFSLSINVALFKPYISNKMEEVNGILAASKKIFYKIGLFFFIASVLISFIYPFFIKSNLDFLTISLIFLMVLGATAFTLFFSTKYQILFQVAQKEYVYTFFYTIVNIISYLLVIYCVYNSYNMLLARFILFISAIVNGIVIYILFKKYYSNFSLKCKPVYDKIKGTKDIVAQKVTGIVYSSLPMLFISTFISTKMSSVYAVYLSIYNVIKNVVNAIVVAPVNGFGQLLASEKLEVVYEKYKTYEYIILIIMSIFTSAVLCVIVPFVKIYTANVQDINYVNYPIAIMMAIIVFFEIIHYPAGHLMNVSGNFKAAKKIQMQMSVVLLMLIGVGAFFFDIYGILICLVICNILLAVLEIIYTHKNIFKQNVLGYVKKLTVNIFSIFIVNFLFFLFKFEINNYISFFVSGIIIFVIVSLVVLFINYIFFKEDFRKIKGIVLGFLTKKKKNCN